MPTLLTSRDWMRLQEIFDAAVELHGSARAAYLDQVCADTGDLRLRVESLLASFEAETQAGGVVEQAAARTMESSLPGVGEFLGPYKITGTLGRGGMGVVFRATRADAEYEKDVAIKVAALSAFSGEFRSRFLRERQILANLDHPHIARLLDGGTTSDGLPFVVMEYVVGMPIDSYCASVKLDRRARVKLMVAVARAVGYAHQHLVVHRDLKPDNIFVTAEGDPKLLDFGIAKALDVDARGLQGTQTIDAARLMTPDYASPEQVQGQPITTATDVYQLGILLYELLSGKRPFKASASMVELERAICETVPPKPNLDPDLDRILLHSLEKEPKRRYPSAVALADDLERYLDGFPVLAHAPSFWYQTAKFVRRHRIAVGAAVVSVLSLIGLSIGMALLAQRAEREAKYAQQQAQLANKTSDFLLGLFDANDPNQGRGDKITARELLDLGAAQLKAKPDEDPVIRVRLLDEMGHMYISLGLTEKGKALLEESIALRRAKLPQDELGLSSALSFLAAAESDLTHFDKALQYQRESLALELKNSKDKDQHIAQAMDALGGTLWELNQIPESEKYEAQAVELSTRLKGRHDPETLDFLNDLALTFNKEGKLQEEQSIDREILAAQQQQLRPDHPQLAYSWTNLGWNLYGMGRFREAEDAMRRGLAVRVSALGPDHWLTGTSHTSLSSVLAEEAKSAEAIQEADEAKRIALKAFGPVHKETSSAEEAEGRALESAGNVAEALTVQREALRVRETLLPADHPMVVRTKVTMVRLMEEQGHGQAALQVLDRVESQLSSDSQAKLGEVYARIKQVKARTLAAMQRFPEAQVAADQAVDAYRILFRDVFQPQIMAEATAARIRLLRGQTEEAASRAEAAKRELDAIPGHSSLQQAALNVLLAGCRAAQHREPEVRTLLQSAVPILFASQDEQYAWERSWVRSHAPDLIPQERKAAGRVGAGPRIREGD